jgi:hypothetical protein
MMADYHVGDEIEYWLNGALLGKGTIVEVCDNAYKVDGEWNSYPKPVEKWAFYKDGSRYMDPRRTIVMVKPSNKEPSIDMDAYNSFKRGLL